MNLVEFCKNKRIIKAVCKREVWTKIAGLLIKQAQYQSARELLEEAKKSALAFDDKRVLALIAYNYAIISFHENDWGKVISYLREVNTLEGTLNFWLKIILLQIDAYACSLDVSTTFHPHPATGGEDKAITVLRNALEMVETLMINSPNKSSTGIHMKAVLEARLARYLVRAKDNLDEKQRMQASELLTSSQDVFIKLGRSRDARAVIKDQLLLLRSQIATANRMQRKPLLVECLDVAKYGVTLSKATVAQIKSVSSGSDIANMCLRVELELAESILNVVEVIFAILKEMTIDEKSKARMLARKDSLLKIVDDYVSLTPVFTNDEQQWNDVTNLAAEDALVLLTHVHSYCDKFPKLQTKATLYLGKCLHQIALQKFPDLQDYVQDLKAKENKGSDTELKTEDGSRENVLQSSASEADAEDVEENPLSEHELIYQSLRTKRKLEPIKHKYAEYIMYITQAAECLTQASQVSLRNGFTDLIAQSCHCFVECVGNRDITASCQFLALFQSAAASLALNKISKRSHLDPHVSRISGLTQQRLVLNESTPNDILAVQSLNVEMLQTESEAYRRLSLTRNHMEILKEIPFHITFIILQHSPDKSTLHCGILEKPRLGLQANKKKDISSGATNRSFISSTKVNADLLDDLVKLSTDFKMDVASLLTRKNYNKQQAEKRKEMLGMIEKVTDISSKEALCAQLELEVEQKRIQNRFEDLLAAMEGYFGKFIGQLESLLTQEPAADTVVLLADEHLLQLPLEALSVFQQPEIKSVTRDFSLQIFYHRFTQGEAADQPDNKNEKTKLGKKDKSDVKNTKSEKTVTNNTNKKAKTSKEFSVGKDGILLDIANLRYIADPTCDWPIEDENNPCNIIADVALQLKNKAAKWVGLRGVDHLPSVAELQKFVQESPNLLFYGFEHFLSHLPPQLTAPLCLTDCHLIILMDLMKTLKSSLRQGKRDAPKSPSDLMLEQPLQTAMLLSLSGAPCVIMNQWQTNLHRNKDKLISLLAGLCESSATVGQALYNCRDSAHPDEPTTHLGEEDADAASERGFANQTKGKSDGKTSKLLHRTSNAGSVRSTKASSPSSVEQSKFEGKQKLGKILKEKSVRKISIDQEAGLTTTATASDLQNDTKVYPYEVFNTVLYGLPNFITSLQG